MSTHATRDTTHRYVEAVSAKDLALLEGLLADDLVATVGDSRLGKDEWITALARLLPALDHCRVRDVLADGERGVVVHDVVSPVATVPCVHVLTVTHGLVRDVQLIVERLHWDEVMAASRCAVGD